MTTSGIRSAVRVVIGVALVCWLVAWVDWRAMLAAIARAQPRWIVAGAIAFSVSTIPAALRLQLLFRRLHLGFAEALRLTLASYFFNQLLPTGFGGEAYRVLRLKAAAGGWAFVLASLLFERAVGALTLLLPALTIAFAGNAASRIRATDALEVSSRTAWTATALTIVLLVAAVVLIRRAPQRWRSLHEQLLNVARELSAPVIGGVIGSSLLFHAARLVGMHAFLAAVGHHVTTGELIVVMALTLLASLVPLSIGALGVREGVVVFALGLCGVPAAEALTVALLNRVLLVIFGVAGGVIAHADAAD
jgi:hypothetical protein